MNIRLGESGNVFEGTSERGIVELALDVVDQALLSESVHGPWNKITLEAAAASVTQLKLVGSEGTCLDAATAGAAGQIKRVARGIGDLNIGAVTTKTVACIEISLSKMAVDSMSVEASSDQFQYLQEDQRGQHQAYRPSALRQSTRDLHPRFSRGGHDYLRLGTSVSTFLPRSLLVGSDKVSMPEGEVTLKRSVISGMDSKRNRYGQLNYHPVDTWGLVGVSSLKIIEAVDGTVQARDGVNSRPAVKGSEVFLLLLMAQFSPTGEKSALTVALESKVLK
jgi:hypothetical protein